MGLYKNNNGTLELISGATLFADNPIGTILPYGGATALSGWLLCQGQAVSRTEYAELFAVIGTAFGNGDGINTFNLPDMTGKTAMGVETGHALGASEDGALPNIEGQWTNIVNGVTRNVVSNTDTVMGAFNYSPSTAVRYTFGTSDSTYSGHSLYFDASKSNSIYTDGQTKVDPANVRVNYIIKAKMVAVPADFAGAAEAAGTAAAEEVVALKQNITDNSLETTAKTVPGAINELKNDKVDRYYITNSSYNLNDATAQGIYELNTSCVNRPSGADGGTMIVTFNPNNNYVVQAYLSTNGAVANRYKPGANAEWTNWVNPFDNRPQLYYAKNVQATSDASGNIILANSKDNVVIVNVRIRGNNTWSLGYSTAAGYYIHVQGYNGETLPNTTVNYDVIYYQYDWTA